MAAAEKEATPHHCPKCLDVFFFWPELRKHSRVSHNHECPKCSTRSFVSAERLEAHLREKHGYRDRRCDTCGFTCQDPSDYSKHLVTHAPLPNVEPKVEKAVWVNNRKYNEELPVPEVYRNCFRMTALAIFLPLKARTPLIETAFVFLSYTQILH